MANWKLLSDEALARRGRDLVRRGHYKLGHDLLSEYCERANAQSRVIGASVMASYGLAVGMTGGLREGLEICQRALSIDRRNGDVWAAIARLSLQAHQRKKAVEAVERGLTLAPSNRELLELRKGLGERRRPFVFFLPRQSAVNVRMGRFLHRLSKDKGGRNLA